MFNICGKYSLSNEHSEYGTVRHTYQLGSFIAELTYILLGLQEGRVSCKESISRPGISSRSASRDIPPWVGGQASAQMKDPYSANYT